MFVSKKIGSINIDYEIVKDLGEGAFGTVKLVKLKEKSDVQRAMKIVKKSLIPFS